MQRCHTYKIAVSKYIQREHWGGVQHGCERRIKVFVKIHFFFIFYFFFGGGGGGRVGVRVDVN